MGRTIIEIEELKKNFGDLQVLEGINLAIQEGEIFGLIGQSGAGKSTLLRTINGLNNFDSGQVVVDGADMADLTDQEIRDLRKNIGMIFQNFSLVSRKTVYENIALPMKLWGESKKAIDARVKELADIVGLSDKLTSYPRQLSGGQKQRVGIARALALEPKILLSDEATSALDPVTTQSILDLLVEINERMDITVVIVTHEIEVIKSICHRTAVLENGQIVEQGNTRDLFIEKPAGLQRLIGDNVDYEVQPGNQLIKLKFYDYQAQNTILSDIGKDTKIRFGVKYIDIDEIVGQESGFALLEVNQTDIRTLETYLTQSNIEWEVA